MIAELARNWWVLLIRGILAILFGIGAFVWPGITIAVLVLMFGAYALVDGIFAIIAGFSARGEHDWRRVAATVRMGLAQLSGIRRAGAADDQARLSFGRIQTDANRPARQRRRRHGGDAASDATPGHRADGAGRTLRKLTHP